MNFLIKFIDNINFFGFLIVLFSLFGLDRHTSSLGTHLFCIHPFFHKAMTRSPANNFVLLPIVFFGTIDSYPFPLTLNQSFLPVWCNWDFYFSIRFRDFWSGLRERLGLGLRSKYFSFSFLKNKRIFFITILPIF